MIPLTLAQLLCIRKFVINNIFNIILEIRKCFQVCHKCFFKRIKILTIYYLLYCNI